MWVLEGNHGSYYLISGEYKIGRKKCCISIQDSSVSRHHANIFVKDAEDIHNDNVFPQISLQDNSSKYGTFVNGMKIAPHQGCVVLKEDDNITLGATSLKVKYLRIVVVISRIGKKQQKELTCLCSKIGVIVMKNPSSKATHLLMDDTILAATLKVLYALLRNQPIVGISWLKAIVSRSDYSTLPKEEHYRPPEPIVRSITSAYYYYEPRRHDLFKGITFIFIEKSETEKLVQLAGAETLSVYSKDHNQYEALLQSNLHQQDLKTIYLVTSILLESSEMDPILRKRLQLAISKNYRIVTDHDIAGKMIFLDSSFPPSVVSPSSQIVINEGSTSLRDKPCAHLAEVPSKRIEGIDTVYEYQRKSSDVPSSVDGVKNKCEIATSHLKHHESSTERSNRKEEDVTSIPKMVQENYTSPLNHSNSTKKGENEKIVSFLSNPESEGLSHDVLNKSPVGNKWSQKVDKEKEYVSHQKPTTIQKSDTALIIQESVPVISSALVKRNYDAKSQQFVYSNSSIVNFKKFRKDNIRNLDLQALHIISFNQMTAVIPNESTALRTFREEQEALANEEKIGEELFTFQNSRSRRR